MNNNWSPIGQPQTSSIPLPPAPYSANGYAMPTPNGYYMNYGYPGTMYMAPYFNVPVQPVPPSYGHINYNQFKQNDNQFRNKNKLNRNNSNNNNVTLQNDNDNNTSSNDKQEQPIKNINNNNNNNNSNNNGKKPFNKRFKNFKNDQYLIEKLRKRIPILDTPEKIAAYIEERKKNYPTKENIKRKQEEEKLKKDTGEFVEGNQNKKRKYNNRNFNKNKRPRGPPNQAHLPKNSNELQNMVNSTPSQTTEAKSNNQTEVSDLEALMMSYTDTQESKIQENSNTNNNNNTTTTLTAGLEDGEEVPESTDFKQQRFNSSRKNNRYNGNNYNKRKPNSQVKNPPTLLQKLLSKEIQQENSIILQCFRYIVDQNFFLENTKKQETEKKK